MTGKAFIILLGALATDGDTLTAGGQAVRLWGIDAPEMDRRAGRRAAGPQGRRAAGHISRLIPTDPDCKAANPTAKLQTRLIPTDPD